MVSSFTYICLKHVQYLKIAILSLLTVFAFCSRCIGLDYPRTVVFDEVHYGSICSLYTKKQFHIDKQPPLFRLLLCFLLPSSYINSSLWESIGKEFPHSFDPHVARLLPGILGVVLVPLSFCFVLKLKFSYFAAILSAFFITFDNGLIVQNRLMVGDAFYHVLLVLSLYLNIHSSVLLLLLSHVCTGLTLSSNYSAVSLWIIIIWMSLQKAWNVCIDCSISLAHGLLQGCLYVASAICTPLVTYFLVALLHISLVSQSGPHDMLMSSSFQASLYGGLKAKESSVKYGSTIRLRASGDIYPYGSCYLNSYPRMFPPEYEDGRGSSSQQVVTCSFQASSWKVVHPTLDKNQKNEVKHGDVIFLVHTDTGRPLNTHNVAAPITKYKQEVSCFVKYSNVSFPEHFEWKIHVLNRMTDDEVWLNLNSEVWLQHIDTGAFLSVTGAPLPEWGLENFEVVAEMLDETNTCSTQWNAEAVSSDSNWDMSFQHSLFKTLENTLEYIVKSWFMSQQNGPDHRFSSDWSHWLLAQSNIPYWYNSSTNAQMHFTGNVTSWCGGLFLFFFLVLYYFIIAIFHRRHHVIISQDGWLRLTSTLQVLGGTVAIYIAYYAFMAPTPTFMYEYLPVVILIHILQACALEVLHSQCIHLVIICTGFYLFKVYQCYWTLRPVTYAFPNKTQVDFKQLQIWMSWEMPFF